MFPLLSISSIRETVANIGMDRILSQLDSQTRQDKELFDAKKADLQKNLQEQIDAHIKTRPVGT